MCATLARLLGAAAFVPPAPEVRALAAVGSACFTRRPSCLHWPSSAERTANVSPEGRAVRGARWSQLPTARARGALRFARAAPACTFTPTRVLEPAQPLFFFFGIAMKLFYTGWWAPTQVDALFAGPNPRPAFSHSVSCAAPPPLSVPLAYVTSSCPLDQVLDGLSLGWAGGRLTPLRAFRAVGDFGRRGQGFVVSWFYWHHPSSQALVDLHGFFLSLAQHAPGLPAGIWPRAGSSDKSTEDVLPNCTAA